MSRRALITGGGRGIGHAITRRLLDDGWRVAVLDNDRAALDEAASRPGVLPILCDVGEEGQILAAAAQIRQAFQGRLHALICNAGIGRGGPLADITLADWNRVLAVNLTSVFLLARECEPDLRAARGAVITIASTRALMSEPHTEAYSASKGGLVALTHALAVSLGPQVRVNAISPGWIDVSGAPEALTPADHAQHPAGRVGTPADVAALAAWLLSDEAGFVTGQNFVVDGGMTRKMIYV